jgi:predicted metal-dependent phosphoesterase TrpH
VSAARRVSYALVSAGLVLGLASDIRPSPPSMARGGFQVLAADLHVHSFLGDGALPPWDLIGEARHRGLHVIAITNHNQVLGARVGRWLSRRRGGPLVLAGQEVTNPDYHLAAVGVDRAVDAHGSAAAAIDAVHAQGGVAIAAHPHAGYAAGLDEEAVRRLDGAERVHPLVYARPREARELAAFFARAEAGGKRLAPIGSSDFHVATALGLCRTYVLAREATERGVLDAVRAGRTVVFDPAGTAYGSPELVRLLDDVPHAPVAPPGRLARASGLCAWLGLVGLILAGAFRE